MKAPLSCSRESGSRVAFHASSSPEGSRRFLRFLLAATVLILPLASCDMLFVGMFPADVAQMTSRIDLSDKIPAGSAATFNLSVLKLGTAEYVLLFSTDGYDPSLAHLFVLSPALQILNEYTLIVLNSLAGDPFKGNGAVAHRADSTIVVGNVVMTPDPSGLLASAKLPPTNALNGDAIVGPGPGFLLWTNFGSDSSGNLTYEQRALRVSRPSP